jgi:hypothetical protein
MREMISTPGREYPEFPAAVSMLPLLTPEDALKQMKLRESRLTEQIAAIDAEFQATADLPRLFKLESEYARLMLDTELSWVRSIIADMESGQITWNQDWMQPDVPPDYDA